MEVHPPKNIDNEGVQGVLSEVNKDPIRDLDTARPHR